MPLCCALRSTSASGDATTVEGEDVGRDCCYVRCMARSIPSGLLAGALAGIAGALAMNQVQRLAAYARGGREAPDATIGIPRTGRGPQPAQAIGNASDDATARIGNAVASTAGYTLTD